VPEDAPVMAALLTASFEGYRSFAPADWTPPVEEPEPLRARLSRPGAWGLVAERDGRHAGHAAIHPARVDRHGELIPGTAYLWMIFVVPEEWGSGLARELMEAALDEARRAGYARITLFTPAGQARARAFYERHGFATTGPPAFDPEFRLDLVEYARDL